MDSKMSVQDAIDVLEKIMKQDPMIKVRITMPYSPDLMQFLYKSGYVPVLEKTAWNDKEIVVSTPKCFDRKLT
jgi:hypothetical protein